MSLALRPDSQWWYGKFRLPNGKFQVKNLNVEVKGHRPPTLRESGDEEFEGTRAVAKSEHDKLLKVMEDKRVGVKFAKAQLELVTAKKHVSPEFKDLPDQWAKDHRITVIRETQEGNGGKKKTVVRYEGALSDSHISHSRGALARFARFMAERHPEVKNMAGATDEHVQAFMRSIDAEKLSDRTWNYHLVLLREVFDRHEPDTSACEYLRETDEREEAPVHRRPYESDQLGAIYEAAKEDPFIRPVVVVGLNTPLRLGDCCQLLCKDVDLPNKFLTVRRTSKTKEGVQIPIWPQLYDELAKSTQTGKYVFPEQAEMYQSNPSGINSRLKTVFESAALRFRVAEIKDIRSLANHFKETRRPIDVWISNQLSAEAKAALKTVASLDGQNLLILTSALVQDLNIVAGGPVLHDKERFESIALRPETQNLIAREEGVSNRRAANRLLLEDAYPVEIARTPIKFPVKSPSAPANIEEKGGNNKAARAGRKKSKNKGGGRGAVPGPRKVNEAAFQALRVTYVTRALLQGVNEEVLRKATGHRTVDIVRKHYFQPSREKIREELDKGRPDFNGDGRTPAHAKLRNVLLAMGTKTWRRCRDEALELLDQVYPPAKS